MLLTEAEARKRIAALPRGHEPLIKWAGYDLPGETADGGLLVVGATGAGKTTMLAQTLHSLLPNFENGANHQAIVFDPKGDLLALLRTHLPPSKLIVINATDGYSAAWDVAKDVQTAVDARHLAEALIPETKSGGTPFFEHAAREVLGVVVEHLTTNTRQAWTLSDLLIIVSKRESLKQIVDSKNSPLTSDANTFANICATLSNALAGYQPLAAKWAQAQSKISFKAWLRQQESVLVVLGDPILPVPERLLRVPFIEVIASSLSLLPESSKWKLWIFSDDVEFSRDSGTFATMIRGRRMGIRNISSLHGIEKLTATGPSPDTGAEILAQFSTVSWLRLNSIETAEWASARTGAAVSPSEFINLPYPASRVLTGFHLIQGAGGVFKGTAHFNSPSSGNEP